MTALPLDPVCVLCSERIDSVLFVVNDGGQVAHIACIGEAAICPDCVKAAKLGLEHQH